MLLTPVVVYGIFALIVVISTGKLFLSDSLARNDFLRTVSLMGLLGLAVSLQIPNGRFDFSIGSILVVSTIVAVNLGIQWGLNSFVTLLLIMAIGCILGIISGLIYVLLNIRAMVVSIGVMMIYEALSMFVFNGQGINVNVITSPVFSLAKGVWGYLAVFAVLTALVYILKKFTKFGYNMRSIRGGQKIAVDAGIKEKRNAVICYALAGLLTGAAGIVYAFRNGGVVGAQSGMSTIGLMFQGFLAMMIGEFLERFDDISFGIFIGAFIASMYHSFLYAIGCSVDTVTLINAFTLLVLLLFNRYYDLIKKNINKLLWKNIRRPQAS